MSTENRTEGDERSGFTVEVLQYLLQTVVYTPLFFLGLGMVTFVFSVYVLLLPTDPLSSYIALVLASWALIFGQLEARDGINQTDRDESSITRFIVSVATVLYYNFMMVLVLVLALIAQANGATEMATAIAILIPAADIYGTWEYNIGFAAVVGRFSYWVGERVTEFYEQIPAQKALKAINEILLSVNDAIPPATRYLHLDTINRRHLR